MLMRKTEREKETERRHSSCCINAGFWSEEEEEEEAGARLQESFYLISSQGAQIPTQREK